MQNRPPADQRSAAEQRTVSDQRPPADQKAAFRAFFGYIRPHRLSFLLVFCCTVLAIAADLAQPYLVKVAIDDNILKGRDDYGTLLVICAIYLGLALAGFLFTYLQNNLLQYLGQNIIGRIRKDLFAHIGKQSMSFFDRMPAGSLITNVSSDTETLNQFFSQVLLSLVRDGLTLIFIIAIMFQLDVTLTLYCLILLPVIALIAIGFRTYMRKTYQISRAALSRLIAFAAENLAGMNLIQAFHQEREQQNRFTDNNRTYLRANLREIRTNVLFNRSFDILGSLSIALVTWLGGVAVFNSAIEFGVLYAFITYIRQFFQPISTITSQWNTLQSTTVSVGRIWSLFAVKPEIEDAAETRMLEREKVAGRIDFNHVRFGYQAGVPVLHDLDLHIAPGEMIGIVGTTGAGKSSLISLLCRFYDVWEGDIRIDGTDIRTLPQSSLHRLVGLVQQEPYLYSGSIVDNIRMFDEEITREEVIRACKFVGADDLIGRLKDGYHTMLSERGSGLSAGERQMISFARIIVFKPKILILDEATANLDSYTEHLIQRALRVVSRERTTLVIAHRLSTVMRANRIIVMSGGRIVESGSHAELLEQHGYYEELYLHSQGREERETG
ncbi:ABC transporter ATP-binding protein [Cohnella sp. GbtcB17]|uniref:ABC transporter ATP-binding protein n=1 Tax=Cohnella sp. GbtcB17 TaxID=2824762 RepID=UPI001C308FD6|nr:ABC transporter ATP-binding protein [Cohnella sp. GbtcB17]